MASPSSPQRSLLRWAMLALLAAFIWTALGGQFSGIPSIHSAALLAANKALADGDLAKATARFDAEVRTDPANAELYETIAGLCIQHKHTDLAIHYLEGALLPCKDLPRPERAGIYLELSGLYSAGEPKPQFRAIYAAQRAAELDPASPKNLNAYGYTLADNNVDIDVAVAKLTLALNILKKQGDMQEDRSLVCMTEDSYGWALYKQGKYDLASTALYQAINDIPEEMTDTPALAEQLKVLYYHLGASYRQQHKPDEARKALQTSLSLDKGYKEAQDELAALNKQYPPPAPAVATPPADGSKQPAASPKGPIPTKTTRPGNKV